MSSKISLKWLLFAVGITVASMLALSVIGSQTRQNQIDNILVKSVQSIASTELQTSGLPTRINIPRINVNSSIEHVGVTPQGAMDVPKGPKNAAWFDLGPRPGEKGSAVIAGHFGWKNNIPAIFDNLHKLQPGDKIYVIDETGTTTTFVVRELRSYTENENSSEVFYSNDGKAHLNLVTCQGIWNKYKKSYAKRLVVFTDKE